VIRCHHCVDGQKWSATQTQPSNAKAVSEGGKDAQGNPHGQRQTTTTTKINIGQHQFWDQDASQHMCIAMTCEIWSKRACILAHSGLV
jgi:hypothetical protein